MKAKLDRMADLLRKASEETCESGYGNPYPDDVAVAGDHVVVATLDPAKDCAPMLEVYERSVAESWYDRAMQYRRCYRRADATEALEETWED